MNPSTAILVGKLLDLLIAGIVIAPAGIDRIRTMVREGRDPTIEEWAALDAQLEEARRRLHADGPSGTLDGVPV